MLTDCYIVRKLDVAIYIRIATFTHKKNPPIKINSLMGLIFIINYLLILLFKVLTAFLYVVPIAWFAFQ